jgi:hypothetical protein
MARWGRGGPSRNPGPAPPVTCRHGCQRACGAGGRRRFGPMFTAQPVLRMPAGPGPAAPPGPPRPTAAAAPPALGRGGRGEGCRALAVQAQRPRAVSAWLRLRR